MITPGSRVLSTPQLQDRQVTRDSQSGGLQSVPHQQIQVGGRASDDGVARTAASGDEPPILLNRDRPAAAGVRGAQPEPNRRIGRERPARTAQEARGQLVDTVRGECRFDGFVAGVSGSLGIDPVDDRPMSLPAGPERQRGRCRQTSSGAAARNAAVSDSCPERNQRSSSLSGEVAKKAASSASVDFRRLPSRT